MIKQILILFITLLLVTACNEGSSKTNSAKKEGSISAIDLKKRKVSDFEAEVTVEIMQGQLKGTHVFTRDPKSKNQLLQINVKRGPGYKEDVTKPITFYVGSIKAKETDYFLINLEKAFAGIIKKGNYESSNSGSSLIIENKSKGSSWTRAKGKLQTHNNVTITEVGEWLKIKRKKEVRRVKGAFSDQVNFSYSNKNGTVTNEIVDVKVAFNLVQTYLPMSSPFASDRAK